jgi:hypothetical protein
MRWALSACDTNAPGRCCAENTLCHNYSYNHSASLERASNQDNVAYQGPPLETSTAREHACAAFARCHTPLARQCAAAPLHNRARGQAAGFFQQGQQTVNTATLTPGCAHHTTCNVCVPPPPATLRTPRPSPHTARVCAGAEAKPSHAPSTQASNDALAGTNALSCSNPPRNEATRTLGAVFGLPNATLGCAGRVPPTGRCSWRHLHGASTRSNSPSLCATDHQASPTRHNSYKCTHAHLTTAIKAHLLTQRLCVHNHFVCPRHRRNP